MGCGVRPTWLPRGVHEGGSVPGLGQEEHARFLPVRQIVRQIWTHEDCENWADCVAWTWTCIILMRGISEEGNAYFLTCKGIFKLKISYLKKFALSVYHRCEYIETPLELSCIAAKRVITC